MKVKKVRTTHADHCPHMKEIATTLAPQIEAVLEKSSKELQKVGVSPSEPSSVTFVSTVTGKAIEHCKLRTGQYWASHAIGAVHFVDAIKYIGSTNSTCVFVDVGDGMLQMFGKATLQTVENKVMRWTSSLTSSGIDDTTQFEAALNDVREWHAGEKEIEEKRSPNCHKVIPKSPSTAAIPDLSSIETKEAIQCKIQPPPHALQADPFAKKSRVSDTTLTVFIPRDATFKHFIQ